MRPGGGRTPSPAGSRTQLRARLVALLGVLAVALAGCSAAPASAPPAPIAAPASGSPSTSPAPTVLGESRPVRVLIPAIGVDSGLMDLGLQDDGALEVAPDGFPAGWFTGAPTP